MILQSQSILNSSRQSFFSTIFVISPQIGSINVHPNLSLRDLRQFQSVLPPGQGEILSLSRDYCSKLTLIPGYQMPLFFPGQNIDLKQSADHFFSNIQFIHHQQIMALQSYQVLVPVPEGFPWWLSWQRIHLQCRRLPAMQLNKFDP